MGTNAKTRVERQAYVDFVYFLVEKVLPRQHRTIPLRPANGSKVFDGISRKILDTRGWDAIYGRWRTIIEDKKEYARCLKIARIKFMELT